MIVRDLVASMPADSIVLSAPGRSSFTYGNLLELIDVTVASLNGAGLRPDDKLAIVLPNGPELAAFFIAACNACTAAPLNPSFTRDEFAFYLQDLSVKALVVEQGAQGAAVEAAGRLAIPVIELACDPSSPAGKYSIAQSGALAAFASERNIALALHTSGTTSRPKIVPLSHRNLLASADNIVRTLKLTRRDRCLNIMPLFHIHGLVAAILSTLASGGSIFCSPGFNALKFFSWMEEWEPTWYSGVPTMHQAILARARHNSAVIRKHPLRFIRSSSAPLPVPVLSEIEATFGCPVIEAYSMTEAAHQMTSNELPPGKRKPGFVGKAAGPEVAIMASDGILLSKGEVGEVVIRGTNVTCGYENNPPANEAAFINGWFRTGDQGVMDDEDFLRITGRIKELINRGGEKIAPLEVDEVLMAHPAVEQVVTFALPHSKLGEEVAAAVVLREGHEASEGELRDFAGSRLAAFKVPRRIVFVSEIPKGATGKLMRIGLARQLGLSP